MNDRGIVMSEKDEMTVCELPSLADATAEELAKAIAEALDAKKGFNIRVIPVADKTVIAEYFVICSGNTSTHIKALVDEAEYRTGLRDVLPYHVEGKDNNSWIVMDYSHVIVHVFTKEAREFYNLEKLYEN